MRIKTAECGPVKAVAQTNPKKYTSYVHGVAISARLSYWVRKIFIVVNGFSWVWGGGGRIEVFLVICFSTVHAKLIMQMKIQS